MQQLNHFLLSSWLGWHCSAHPLSVKHSYIFFVFLLSKRTSSLVARPSCFPLFSYKHIKPAFSRSLILSLLRKGLIKLRQVKHSKGFLLTQGRFLKFPYLTLFGVLLFYFLFLFNPWFNPTFYFSRSSVILRLRYAFHRSVGVPQWV